MIVYSVFVTATEIARADGTRITFTRKMVERFSVTNLFYLATLAVENFARCKPLTSINDEVRVRPSLNLTAFPIAVVWVSTTQVNQQAWTVDSPLAFRVRTRRPLYECVGLDEPHHKASQN